VEAPFPWKSRLVKRQVTVIAAGASTLIAKAATATIPIVGMSSGDPVRSGLVASLNRPGGNVTAVGLFTFSLGPKRFELLRELVPNANVIAVLANHSDPDPEAETDLKGVETAALARIFGLDTKDVALICLCYVANPTSAQIRYAVRRLRRKAPKTFILVSMMGGADNASGAEEVRACQADDVRQSLSETIDQIKNLARGVKDANDPSGDSLVSKAG
jgi:ABC transporter substrate binding protein